MLSCGGGGSTDSGNPGSSGGAATGDAWVGDSSTSERAEITVLMMGNSHTSLADLPRHLDQMLRAGLGGRTVGTAVVPSWHFLDGHLANPASMALLESRRWTAVVLQAQKYSSSGLYSYSTAEAEELVRRSRRQGALPVLFPEWPRRGEPETLRIYSLHTSIAEAEPACVAPIGQAWDLSLQRDPALPLHASDGNHANRSGSYLAALMLYRSLTGGSPLSLPDLDNGITPAVQARLRQVAADTAAVVDPRQHCPADVPLIAAPAAQRDAAAH